MQMSHSRLVDALREIGFRHSAPAFTPHVTLFRASRKLKERAIAETGWTGCDFVFVRKLYGGREYELLGSWKLPDLAYHSSALTAPAS